MVAMVRVEHLRMIGMVVDVMLVVVIVTGRHFKGCQMWRVIRCAILVLLRRLIMMVVVIGRHGGERIA